jgi:MSHA pilin protein MshC
MVELITVMVLIGVLAAFAVPRLMGDSATGAALFGDQVASGLRMAQKSAVARRRTVCVTTTATTLTLRVRTAVGNGPCDVQLQGITDDLYDSKEAGIVMSGAPPLLLFRPDGTIDDGNGVRLGRVDIAIKGANAIRRTITLDGGTGYVH